MGVVGTHFIDNFLMLVGEKCVSVSGMVDTRPMVDCRNSDDPAFKGECHMNNGQCLHVIGRLCLSVSLSVSLSVLLALSVSLTHSLSYSVLPLRFCAAIQGETNIEDPGGFGVLKMESGLVATVCAGNSLSGAASIRLCVAEDLRLLIAALPLPPTDGIHL